MQNIWNLTRTESADNEDYQDPICRWRNLNHDFQLFSPLLSFSFSPLLFHRITENPLSLLSFLDVELASEQINLSRK